VRSAGGVPILLPPVPGVEVALDGADALILSGGPDIDARRYGERPHPAGQPPQSFRDAVEFTLLAKARRRGLAVLAVCRGAQLLNVASGGSLIQHLPETLGHDRHSPMVGTFGRHRVRVAPGSRLAQLTGWSLLDTPTHHHQAVDRLGVDLVAVAWADDGVVEAIEDPSMPFRIGVQWHPEEGAGEELLAALVEAAARGSRRGDLHPRTVTR
jgi:gamma-glutamyl-gamma-aminobutyrate hydrolase PuuD